MMVGVGLPNAIRNITAASIPQWAIEAEGASFSSCASFGRFGYPGVSDTVTLAAAAAVTRTVKLLSAVLIAPAWPPSLLAKEVAGIAGISNGRLTLGVGVGVRADDFPVSGRGLSDRGRRLDQDLPTLRELWAGVPMGRGQDPIVPEDTPEIPLLFGAMSPAGMARMAMWGKGYIGPGLPATVIAPFFDGARAAWQQAGRAGEPHLVGVAYYGLADDDGARAYVADYYSATPNYVDTMVSGVATTAREIASVRDRYEDMGVHELVFCPTSPDVAEVGRLADALRL